MIEEAQDHPGDPAQAGRSAGRRLMSLRGSLRAGPLANRNFLLLCTGQVTSIVGDYCYAVAMPWLVLSTRGGVLLLGTVLACYGVPRVVCIPIGGLLADKVSPRKVMLAADIGRCIMVAVLAVCAARRFDGLAVVGPLAAFIGAGEGLFIPGSYSIIPSILPEKTLQAGNALFSTLTQGGSVLGPVIGGVLVSAFGPAPAFAVDAASFAVSAAALMLMAISGSRAPADEDPQVAIADEPADGAPPGAVAEPVTLRQMLRRSHLLHLILLVVVVSNLAFGGTFGVALPELAHAQYGATGYGILVACFGAGAVLGSLLAINTHGIRRPAVLACGAILIEAIGLCVVPFTHVLGLTVVPILVFGACSTGSNIVMITAMQKWAPDQMLSRIMGVLMLASMGSYPASVALAGVLMRHVGTAPFFFAAGAVLAVTMILVLAQRELRNFGMSSGSAPAPADQSRTLA